MSQHSVDRAVEILVDCYKDGGKLLVCGNGGSAADSAHIVGELVKGFMKRRHLPESWRGEPGFENLQMGLPAIDLTAQGAAIAAISNDIGGEWVYAQQVMAYGKKGDVLLGISTSGNAENVCLAAQTAHRLGMKVIGLTGLGGGKLASLCDLLVDTPERTTYLVQEHHIRIYHEICARIEAEFFEE